MSNSTVGNVAATAQILSTSAQALATIFSALIVALVGTIGAALITRSIQKKRNIQDRESQWRSHAVELAKLEVDRLIKTRGPKFTGRPVILDFLAFYRDLQELNDKKPKELYAKIIRDRVNPPPINPTVVISNDYPCIISCGGEGEQGHPLVFLTLNAKNSAICPYCNQKYARPFSPRATS